MMKKLRWAMDEGGFWEVDLSTPVTLEGVARPVTGDAGDPLRFGLSRGARLSRPKQLDFFQRFMAMAVVPSFSPAHGGFSLQRVLSLPFGERWFATLLGQFNIQKLVSSLKHDTIAHPSKSSWLQSAGRIFSDKSLYALNICSELLLTPDNTLLLCLEEYGDEKNASRKKAVLHHKFPQHNLTVEAGWPGLVVDQEGNYWDLPFTLAFDLGSVPLESGASYHLCINHASGSPKLFEGRETSLLPATVLPGLSVKCAVSLKKNAELWTSETPMLRMVQPYDIFLSNPHVRASAILGAAITASMGHNAIRGSRDQCQKFKSFNLQARRENSAVLADLFASFSLSAQFGHFQKMFLDLSRFYARFDFPSGSKLISGATSAVYDLYRSQMPCLEAVQAICPSATISFQQQIAGPFSFRAESGLKLDLKSGEWFPKVNEPVFALEYALQVLGSAKAVAWYSPKQQEFMIELRFFET